MSKYISIILDVKAGLKMFELFYIEDMYKIACRILNAIVSIYVLFIFLNPILCYANNIRSGMCLLHQRYKRLV